MSTSIPLSFAHAARIWSAAAGIAGAFFPEAFEIVCREWSDWSRPDSETPPMEALVEEAIRRAEFRAALSPWADRDPFPARPTLDGDGLAWITSVRCLLAGQDGHWFVDISPRHETREAAAEGAARTIGIDALWEPGCEPEMTAEVA